MAPYMSPIYPSAATAGSAITVLSAPGDNWMLHVAVEICQPCDVVVMATTSGNTDGYFGELLATSMASKGVRGVVIDAGCRDIRKLSEMKYPV
jgi:4-hydroxy-4-methyl-2-oxoglutarate aldolase